MLERIPADAGLQVVYVLLGLYGWYQWLFGGAGRTRLTVRVTSGAEWWALGAATVVLTGVLWWFLEAFTASTVAWADALTTALSLVATYGQTRKLVQSWWVWIAADLVYIPLYAYKGLSLTAVLYLVFLALCVVGLRAWRAALHRPAAPVAAPPAPAVP